MSGINYQVPVLDSSIRYLALEAPKDTVAQALAARAGLPLDGDPLGAGRGLVLYLFRLIVLGLDTPDNLRLLFGPDWEANVKRLLLEQRFNAQSLAGANGKDASTLPGYLNRGIPQGQKVNVTVMSPEEHDEAMQAVFMR